jgi:hypothetical protein
MKTKYKELSKIECNYRFRLYKVNCEFLGYLFWLSIALNCVLLYLINK